MSAPIKVSVVVAVQHAQDNLPQIMAALAPSRHPGVEILVCHTDADPDVARRIVSSDIVRVIAGERASLAPHFWSDNIRAARGPAVALIIAHCIPDADWIGRLLAADLNHYVGVGGVAANDPAADAKSEATFLLRYLPYSPPQSDRNVSDTAADNAVYRRDQILALRLDPMLRAVHQYRYNRPIRGSVDAARGAIRTGPCAWRGAIPARALARCIARARRGVPRQDPGANSAFAGPPARPREGAALARHFRDWMDHWRSPRLR